MSYTPEALYDKFLRCEHYCQWIPDDPSVYANSYHLQHYFLQFARKFPTIALAEMRKR